VPRLHDFCFRTLHVSPSAPLVGKVRHRRAMCQIDSKARRCWSSIHVTCWDLCILCLTRIDTCQFFFSLSAHLLNCYLLLTLYIVSKLFLPPPFPLFHLLLMDPYFPLLPIPYLLDIQTGACTCEMYFLY